MDPPGLLFWAYATGAARVAAGLAILTGVPVRLAAGLLTVMFAAFGVLLHAPLAFADPASHLNWVMNAMNLALTGAAWVVANSLAERRAPPPGRRRPPCVKRGSPVNRSTILPKTRKLHAYYFARGAVPHWHELCPDGDGR